MMRYGYISIFLSFFTLIATSNALKASPLTDSITYAKRPFHGHSLVHNGRHLNLRKVARSYSNNKEVQILFKQIRKRRLLLTACSVPVGMMLGMGVAGVIVGGDLAAMGALSLAGAGLGFYGMILYDLQDKQDMQRLADILP